MNAPSRPPSDTEGDGPSVILAACDCACACGVSMVGSSETQGGGETCCVAWGYPELLGAPFRVEMYSQRSRTLSGVSGEKWRTIVAINSRCTMCKRSGKNLERIWRESGGGSPKQGPLPPALANAGKAVPTVPITKGIIIIGPREQLNKAEAQRSPTYSTSNLPEFR
ncbi:hypothetical protein BGZ61DRAFT_487343 [Ilyonectria robusta]|uniref:uncharacterized protein n=1 Tax=Ilyonectria robusta TaxID=1079257 RepID=UPI001E8CD7FF|nr:uncharacterized protein BGZ61DRAFT_487343 [Ilyonectria robusta]KAH8652988.1 hypothetical protein BGZ61DRAFT_487343 [Ilyonectria robusta]